MNKVNFIFLDGSEVNFNIQKDVLIVGRDPGCDIVLPFQGFSRKHVKFEFLDDKIYVTDLESSNGVLINGKKIPPGLRTPYQTTTNLQFGPLQATVFKFEDKETTRLIPISLMDLPSTELNTSNDEGTRMIKIPKMIKPVSNGTKKSRLVQVKEKPKKNISFSMTLGVAIAALALLAAVYHMTH